MAIMNLNGCVIHKEYLDVNAQHLLVSDVRKLVATAPLFSPLTPWGKPMRVKMTSAGKFGWFSDQKGYRYERAHPSGSKWPPIPASVLRIWADLVSKVRKPDCCLVNFYGKDAKMGLHQDKDEADFEWPVLSISLGDSGLFRVGGTSRKDPTQSIWLESGDVAILGGDARLAFHGIDRVKHGTSTLLSKGGRLNLTCRVVE